MSNENKKALVRLFNEETPEMMPNELKELLEAELAKPEEEMDTQFISELLELLEAATPSAQDKEADWNAILAKLEKGKKKRPNMTPRKIAAIAASVVVVFALTLTSAKAINWHALFKLLLPFAQTFGIVSPNYEIGEEQVVEYWSEDAPLSQEIDLHSLEEMPTELGKAIVESQCIPDGYTFIQGTWFMSGDTEKYSLYFTRDDQWIGIDILSFDGEVNGSFDYEFEQQAETPESIIIDGLDVTLYQNSSDSGIYVSWLLENAHYTLYGTLSEDELETIITALHTYQRDVPPV